MRAFMIVALSLVGITIFLIMWVWYVVFGKSLRKMLVTILDIIFNRNQLVDPDAEILPNTDKYASDALEEIAAHVKADVPLEAQFIPPQAMLPASDRDTLAQTTSDNGWPRQLNYETRHAKHPFLEVNLRTETEQTHEIMDVDTYNSTEAAGSQSDNNT
jgi:hypothetical protein